MNARPAAALTALAAALVLVGCGQETGGASGTGLAEQRGDPATWTLADDLLVDPASTFFVADVTRLGCASGRTGEVLEPEVSYEDDRVLVRIDVEHVEAGDCPSNVTVPTEVYLTEPLGMRPLVDGACVEGDAVGTPACRDTPASEGTGPAGDGGVRWTPPSGLTRADGVPTWQGPADYSFTVQSSCGEQAFIGEYAVTVRDGAVTAAEPLRQGQEIALELVPTLTGMLDLAREAGGGDVEVWVDPEGVPRWVTIDPDPRSIDDESCFFVTEYRLG